MAKTPMTSRMLPPGVEKGLDAALDKALAVQQSAIISYVDRLRAKPGATPASVVRALERRYLTALTAIGAASGGVAAVPGVGTVAALASGVAEIAAFVEATAVFALGVSEVYGYRVEDPDARRALVLAVLLGEAGAASIEAAGVAGSKWGPVLAHGVNREAVTRVNKRLMKHFTVRFGAGQGALMFGRALPFGIGAGIGAAGNIALGRSAIKTVRQAFPRPPAHFGPRIIDAEWTDA
jgi:hypothetical protein